MSLVGGGKGSYTKSKYGELLIKDRRRNEPVSEFVINTNNFALDKKLKQACIGLKPALQWAIKELPRDEDKELIADFIINWSTYDSSDGSMMSPNTKRAYVNSLVYLARHFQHKKSFKEMTRQDIIDSYLNSLKKDLEQDPDLRWVNTYNNRASNYLAFWKWMTQPDLRREERQTPPQLKGFRFAKRKQRTSVKREHFWTPEEHRVFLKYCEDPRLACYHAIARDTGARPSELLALKISDLQIRTSPSTGRKYAEFWIGRTGKMKKGRPVSISDAIPYFNVWVAVHPRRDSPQGAYLFPAMDNKSKYHNAPLKVESLRFAYRRTLRQQEFFPQLLVDRPDIPLEDKATIKTLIKKPFYPYLRRHEFATELVPKVPQYVFNQLMGHARTSKMYDVYVQDLGDEGNRELLISRGILTRDETISQAQLELQPKYCPICSEPNKQQADFCFKCNWIVSKKGMEEVKEKDELAIKEALQQKKQMQQMSQQFEEMKAEMAKWHKLFESQALHIAKDSSTIEQQREKLGEIPPLCPYDTVGILSDNPGKYPPELEKLMFTPWNELERPENKEKKKRLEELLKQVDEFS